MAEAPQLACPMMPASARLEADDAWRERREEPGYLGSPKPFPQQHVPGDIDTMNLEDLLCQVETND
jgi:hypothetical protein